MAKGAVEALRRQGVKAGLFRPVSVWPFPIDALKPLLPKARRVVVVEASAGQLEDELRLALSHAGAARAPDRIRPPHGRRPASGLRGREGGPGPRGGDRVSVFYENFERHAGGAGPQGARDALLPGLRPRPRPQVPRRRDRGARHPGPHGRDLARRMLRLPLLLLRRRQLAGRARPRSRGRDRPQARESRVDRRELPGRRRPRVDRPRGDRLDGAARHPDHRHLREQRDLRHDGRPDGAHDAHGPEERDEPGRPQGLHGPADEDGRAHLGPRRAGVRRARRPLRRQAAHQGAEGDQEGDEAAGREPRLRVRRGPRGVPDPPRARRPRKPRSGSRSACSRSSRSA